MALVGQAEDRNGSDPAASSSGLPQFSQEEHRGTPQDGSALHFSHERDSNLESGGGDSDVLDSEDLEFLMNHIQK